MYRLYLKHLIFKVCLYFACNKDFISCFKGHNVKAFPFRDVPPLQNLRVWGSHCSSVSAFTATRFGARFTVSTQTWGKYPPPPPPPPPPDTCTPVYLYVHIPNTELTHKHWHTNKQTNYLFSFLKHKSFHKSSAAAKM